MDLKKQKIIFFSYSILDSRWADEIIKKLEKAGYWILPSLIEIGDPFISGKECYPSRGFEQVEEEISVLLITP